MLSIQIGNIIDKAVFEVFQAHRRELFFAPIGYTIQAVWGTETEGKLSPRQKELNNHVLYTLGLVRGLFMVENLDVNQDAALDYLIRSLISTKIMHMTALSQYDADNEFSSAFEWLDSGSALLM